MPRQPDQLGGEVQPGGADQLAPNTIELASGLASEMAAPAANAEAADGQPINTSGTLQAAAGFLPLLLLSCRCTGTTGTRTIALL